MSWGESTEAGSEEGGLDRAKCRQQRCPREGSGAARVREPGSELTLNIHRLPHAFPVGPHSAISPAQCLPRVSCPSSPCPCA